MTGAMRDDLIRYILERVAAALPGALSSDIARMIEQETRRYWGGDKIHIAKNGEDLSERNAAIRRDWRNGERTALIARRYKISRSQVWRIVRRSN